MPKDHYVAETYLKHFVGPDKMLHAYRKSDGKYFPCHPKDICRELDGDIIKDFLSDPTLLGQYRKMFESEWNPAVADLQTGRPSQTTKMAIAGYWGNLLVCTPARLRVDVKSHDYAVMQHLRATDALKTQAGRPDAKLKEMLQAFDSGMYRLDTEPGAMRAMRVRHVMRLAWTLYNSNWIIIKNNSGTGFLTSDNPVSFDDPGIWRGGKPSLPRYLPISPNLCLHWDTKERPQTDPDFSQPPKGAVRHATIETRGVRRINRAIAQCAEDLVISSCKHPSVESLARKYARHKIDVEFIEIRGPDSFIFGMRDRVRARE